MTREELKDLIIMKICGDCISHNEESLNSNCNFEEVLEIECNYLRKGHYCSQIEELAEKIAEFIEKISPQYWI